MRNLIFQSFDLLAKRIHVSRIGLVIKDFRSIECRRICTCGKQVRHDGRVPEVGGYPKWSKAEFALLMQIDAAFDEQFGGFEISPDADAMKRIVPQGIRIVDAFVSLIEWNGTKPKSAVLWTFSKSSWICTFMAKPRNA
ncbi:hypothetical protein [Rhodanobacter sp. 7MK24]|uniref:hypothetical protein n=1 Tax=Rhodanobacter sp. 7MK24 TaxID=2775922 RepID=UPI00210846CC|nr:hypothetical protein [Rhodanobacter sp. 7MK24]